MFCEEYMYCRLYKKFLGGNCCQKRTASHCWMGCRHRIWSPPDWRQQEDCGALCEPDVIPQVKCLENGDLVLKLTNLTHIYIH